MTGKVHLGVTTIVMIGAEPPLSIPLIVGCIIGSFLPDCDTPKAMAGLFLPTWIVTRHRGAVHSWLMCIAFSCVAAAIDIQAGIGLFIGYALHLLLDATTPMGLPSAFWPYKKKSF